MIPGRNRSPHCEAQASTYVHAALTLDHPVAPWMPDGCEAVPGSQLPPVASHSLEAHMLAAGATWQEAPESAAGTG